MLTHSAAHTHGAAGRGCVAGVGKQVDQHLGQALGITLCPVIRVAEVEELYFEIAPVQRQQTNGILRDFGQAHRLLAVLVAATCMGEAHQRLDDARNAFGLFDDLAGEFDDLSIAFTLFAQVLRKAGDAGDRVADLMGHARSQATDARQAL